MAVRQDSQKNRAGKAMPTEVAETLYHIPEEEKEQFRPIAVCTSSGFKLGDRTERPERYTGGGRTQRLDPAVLRILCKRYRDDDLTLWRRVISPGRPPPDSTNKSETARYLRFAGEFAHLRTVLDTDSGNTGYHAHEVYFVANWRSS